MTNDELRQDRAEAAEKLLADLVYAVEQAGYAKEAGDDEKEEKAHLARAEAEDALRAALDAATSNDRVAEWKEHLQRVAERESNVDHICTSAMRTRDLLESTRIELELVVQRLASRLRARAERELASQHEHAANVLKDEADFLETLTDHTLDRVNKFLKEV